MHSHQKTLLQSLIILYHFYSLSAVFTHDFYNSRADDHDGSFLGDYEFNEIENEPVHSPISTRRTFEMRPVVFESPPPIPSVVNVEPSETPVQVIFRTQSSPVLVQQVHMASAPTKVHKSYSEDEAHKVIHEVFRPVLQEVYEHIQPYRRVVQKINPVIERVHTVVAKNDRQMQKDAENGFITSNQNIQWGDELWPRSADSPAEHNLDLTAQHTHKYQYLYPQKVKTYQMAKVKKIKQGKARRRT